MLRNFRSDGQIWKAGDIIPANSPSQLTQSLEQLMNDTVAPEQLMNDTVVSYLMFQEHN